MRKLAFLCFIAIFGLSMLSASAQQHIPSVEWDRYSLIIDGKRVMPVMGEIHYSRVPAEEWRDEVRKIKEGGVTIIASYIFWNHHEEQEGIYRWDGQRNLREFLNICKEEGMPVVIRIGPFCHGEVRNGGIPDWVFSKSRRLRTEDPAFMACVERFYRQVYTQIAGLQWKDGGPVIACQFDNEYSGHGSYLQALKDTALSIGFDLPFYTRTGWPALRSPVAFGEMIPLYGDYADGFWDKGIEDAVGNYYKAFNFKQFRSSTAIGTDLLGEQKETKTDDDYPYFTCELGGGMATAYHRRPYIYPEDIYSLALIKLGSGSNLLGYYMYHGGTNPEGITTLNETQRTLGTANNDITTKTYDFQAPLGEFGQTYPQYYMIRKLHLFMQDYGEILAPMEASFPAPQDIAKGDDSALRWSYRSSGDSGFVFINNYERLQNISAKKNVRLEVCGVKFPKMTIPAGAMCIFPVNIDGISYATAQLVAKRDGKIYMVQIPGIPTTISIDGKTLKNLKPRGVEEPVYGNIYLLDQEEAGRLFLAPAQPIVETDVEFSKVREAGPQRVIRKGRAGVAEAPSDEDYEQAAVYRISIAPGQAGEHKLLSIEYQGDCARLYVDGKFVADNFNYGRPFLYGLWRLPEDCKEVELRIMPLQEGAPVYMPREADKTPGESVKSIKVTNNGLN